MEDINCDICLINFDDKEHIPKLLKCGHTFCRTCIIAFQRRKKCPNCNTEISVANITEYATNYSLLRTINSYKNFASSSWNIKHQIDKLKLSLVSILENLREYASTFNEVTEAVSKLENLNTKKYSELEIIDTLNCLTGCKKILISAQSFIKFKRKDVDIKIKLEDINSTGEFMNELIRQMRSGLTYFAVHQVEQEYKFGKLELDPEFPDVFFARSLSNPTIEQESHCVLFSDLKKCFINNKPMAAFIEIPINLQNINKKILIRLNDTALAAQFLKICSGETGALYRETKNEIGFGNLGIIPLISVREYMVNGNSRSSTVDYDLGLSFSSRTYAAGTTLVEGFRDGGFKMFSITKDSKYEDIIGLVYNHEDVTFSDCSEIIDSGMAYCLA